MRKLAIIDKNTQAQNTQWKAAPDPKNFFLISGSSVAKIKKYDPDIVFINKGFEPTTIKSIINGYKSIYFYGDYYTPIPTYVKQIAGMCDAVVLTNKDKALWRELKAGYGQKNIHFASMGADTDTMQPVLCKKKYDVLFVANYFGSSFCGSDIRLEFATKLKERFKDSFTIVGNGWPQHFNALPKHGGPSINKTINESKLTVGMSHFINVPYYTSNRIYQSMATGIPHIAWYSPGVKNIFKKGYIEVSSYGQLFKTIKKFLHDPYLRSKVGLDQYFEIKQRHTIYHFWDKIEKIIKELKWR
jgi:hypothetical protein